ncbi:MAG: OB-fold nucleic acid binding domain-containing protein [Methanomicrobiales archaeon]|nr:OB-fold nucleic acid binding domain-containing protein [Methanomicrobiales archaeon]
MGLEKGIIVYHLSADCTLSEVEEGKIYIARVQGFANFGTFVQLNDRVKGLIHKSNLKTRHNERDPVLVKVLAIRSNGNIDLEEVTPSVYHTEVVVKKSAAVRLKELSQYLGRSVRIEGIVAQIKQTSGPTIFTISDGSGIGNAAAFIEAGVRAYPEVQLGDTVTMIGEVMTRNSQLQVEVSSLAVMTGEDGERVRATFEAVIEARAEPEDLPFLIKSETLEKLKPAMRKVAKLIRRAIFEAQPIIIRHHADADGICAAVAIELAVTGLLRENGSDFDADYFMMKRAPSKAPFYELEDITRDLDFALKDRIRYGQKLPMVILMDNGSTMEDEPSLTIARIFRLPVIVVDHHHPDQEIDQYLRAHVNPYHVGGDFGITSGMLGTEIARMINPAIEGQIRHFPAVSAVGDRSEAGERSLYLSLVRDEYSEEHCKEIALALDYEQFWLRFNDGREIVKYILDVTKDAGVHQSLIRLLVDQANGAIEEQMAALMPHVEGRRLHNGAHLFLFDVELFAHKFTFPPPGKTSGEVHDRLCKEHPGEPVVSIGVGPDFAVLRSKGVLMNIPRMVRELRDEITGGGISGGGHLVVGSIKFVEGMRTTVIEGLVAKIGRAETQSGSA